MRTTRRVIEATACGLLFALLMPVVAGAEYGDGSIIGWGDQVVGVDLSADFVAVAAGGDGMGGHSLGLKAITPGPPGDLDCDGDPFVLALTGQEAYDAAYPDCNWLNADCNDDGEVDFDDIDPFVAILSGG